MEQKVKVSFLEKDKFEINASLSGAKIYADKTVEGSEPAGPNPLELFLSSLGSCVGVFSKRYLVNHNIEFKRLAIEVKADFITKVPMRLDNIKVNVDTDAQLGDKKDAFLRFIKNCPIHNTILHTKDIEISLD